MNTIVTYLSKVKYLILAGGLVAISASCTPTQRGATIGGLGGAALGAAVADDSGTGALIGGAGGAIVGGMIGRSQEERYYHRGY